MAFALALALLASACAPRIEPAGPAIEPPSLSGQWITAADGARLPLRRWLPEGKPRAALVALHGFNDYSNAFAGPAKAFAAAGIATYAYDQRGFGAAPNRGMWPGVPTLVADAKAAARLVRRAQPGIPVYMIGDSMGGAVALLATTGPDPAPVDGAILVGPAVFSRDHLGAVPRALLWVLARIIPWYPLTGQGIHVQASDNVEMLRALGRDPLVLKETRVDAVSGLFDLMDAALAASARIRLPTLVMYGTKDELVPDEATRDMLGRLPKGAPVRVAIYHAGYHMLLRDLDAKKPIGDIIAWISDHAAALPSGADSAARRYLGKDQTSAHMR